MGLDISNFARTQVDPSELTTSVIVAGSTFTGTVLGGSGDNLNAWAATTSGKYLDVRLGSAGSPDAALNAAVKVSRTVDVVATAITGDGSEQLAAIEGITTGIAANQVQTVGVFGAAIDKGTNTGSVGGIFPDACGVYGVGRIEGSGIGTGIGGSFVGHADSPGAFATMSGIQVSAYNGRGVDQTVSTAGFSGNGMWIWSSGPNKVGAGIEFGNPSGSQFDVGVHFNAQVTSALTGAAATASIQDDCTSATSLLIKGTHATAAIAVASGSGQVLIGGTAHISATPLLEVQAPNAGTRPVAMFGNSNNTQTYSIFIQNGPGFAEHFVVAATNAILTGTASGDVGVRSGGTGSFFHIGGTSSVIKVGQANTLGFFNVTAVAQPSAVGAAAGYAAGTTAATFHSDDTYTGGVGTTGYTLNGIVAALKNLGLIHT